MEKLKNVPKAVKHVQMLPHALNADVDLDWRETTHARNAKLRIASNVMPVQQHANNAITPMISKITPVWMNAQEGVPTATQMENVLNVVKGLVQREMAPALNALTLALVNVMLRMWTLVLAVFQDLS